MSMNVDKAWDKLYLRLKEEELLVTEDNSTGIVPFAVKMKRAAAIVALCICGGAMALYLNVKKESELFVSMYNSDTSKTLVSTLNDGSIVYLASGAELTCLEEFADDRRQVSLKGEALFDVHGNKERPFLIDTEPALVEVTGTEFNIISTGKESFELSVQHGTVTATLKSTGIPVQVESGEKVLLQAGQLQKVWLADQHLFARYSEKMHFKDERLENIVRVINKISDQPVVLADSALGSRELTIAFSNDMVAEMVELVCEVLNLTYTDDGKAFIIGR